MRCKKCNKEIPADSESCPVYGQEVIEHREDGSEYKGLGGWLILVCLGLIVSALYTVFILATTYWPIFTDGSWELLTTPNSEFYIPGIGSAMKFDIVGGLVIAATAVYLLVLFFRKDKRFPTFYIIFLIASLLYVLISYAWATSIPELNQERSESLGDIGRSILAALIWIPYMLKSKRVRATFA
jgi:hypothetical protein